MVLHEGEEKEQNNQSDADSDDTEEEEEEFVERRSNLERSKGQGSDGNYSDDSESGNEGDFDDQKSKETHRLFEKTSEIVVLETVPKKPPGPTSRTQKIPPGPPGPPMTASAPTAKSRPPPGPPAPSLTSPIPRTPIPRKAISSSSHSAKTGSWYDCCMARLSTHPDFEKPFSRALQERLLATLDTPTATLPG